MYVDGDAIINFAAVVTALGVIGGLIIGMIKFVQRDKHQSEVIRDIQEEQRVICRGLRGALAGLIEQGCNGPCKEALAALDEHLNKEAHHKSL